MHSPTRWIKVVGLAAVALVLGACGTGAAGSGGSSGDAPVQPGPNGTLVIGTVGDFSGANSPLSTPLRDAVIAWSKDVNAHGGIGGRTIQVVVGDAQSDPAKATSVVRDLVENKKVIALVGVDTPTTQESWAAYATQIGLPIIGGNGATASWSKSPNMFTAGTTLANRYLALQKSALTKGMTKIGVFYCAEIASCQTAVALNSPGGAGHADGADLVASSAVSASTPDYTAQCLNARDKGAQAVILAVTSGVASRVGEACAQQGYKPTWLLTGSTFGQAVETQAFDGALTQDSYFLLTQKKPGIQRFLDAMATYEPKTVVNGSAAAAWAGGLMLEKAAADLPANPTSADVLKGMYSIKDQDLGVLPGPITFTQGQPHDSAKCLWWGTFKFGTGVEPAASPICAG